MSKAGKLAPTVMPAWQVPQPAAATVLMQFSHGHIAVDPGTPRSWAGVPPFVGDRGLLPVCWLRDNLQPYVVRTPDGALVNMPRFPGDLYEAGSALVLPGRPVRTPRCVVATMGLGKFSFPGVTPDVLDDPAFLADLERGGVNWFEANPMDFDSIHFGLPCHGIDTSHPVGAPPNDSPYDVVTHDTSKYVGGELLLLYFSFGSPARLFLGGSVSDAQALALFEFYASELTRAAPNFGKLGRYNLQQTFADPHDPKPPARWSAFCGALGPQFGGNTISDLATLGSVARAQVRDFFNL